MRCRCLLGRNPGPDRARQVDRRTALPECPAGLPSELLDAPARSRCRPSTQLVAANAQIGAAKRALLSDDFAYRRARRHQQRARRTSSRGRRACGATPASSIGPIFTFGAVSGQVAQAEAPEARAPTATRLTIQNAFADVENALVAHQKLQEQLDAQERLVAALRDYARLATLQYNGGYAPYTTVLQAEQSLFPAELQLATVRARCCSAIVNIYKAMGGGWVAAADTLTTGNAPVPVNELGRPAAAVLACAHSARDYIAASCAAARSPAEFRQDFRQRGVERGHVCARPPRAAIDFRAGSPATRTGTPAAGIGAATGSR